MNDPLKFYLDNDFMYDIKEHRFYKCPCCDSKLYTINSKTRNVLDGNVVFHCGKVKEHKFWVNPREYGVDILHQNERSSDTCYKSEQDWELVNKVWYKI